MKKIRLSEIFVKIYPIFFVLVGTFPAITPILQPGYFPMHDDLQAMRQLQMDKCFRDLQIPCRWVPDMGYGFGYPLFNYYPPLPYYLGEIIHLLGFSILDTVKVLFILVFLVSALTMYLLAKEFWGDLGGAVSALFYVWAPYHAVDVYVRGAMNEAWAIAFAPLILWSIYKVIEKDRWVFVPITSFSIAMFALSHNPTLMVFAPGAILWALFWLWQKRSLKSLLKLIFGGIWSLGLAAFFTLPVIFELKYVHVETLFIGYFNYLAHFLNLNQLFVSRYWGYGESVLGPADTMSFSLGHFHWIGTVIALFVAWSVRKKMSEISAMIIFIFFLTYFYTFLTHQRSALIWKLIPQLATLQFPWRILAISAIGTSFLAGSIFILLKKIPHIFRLSIAGVVIIALVLFNLQFFTWKDFFPSLTDSQKFSGQLWQLQQTAGIFDYLPKQLPLPPKNPPSADGEIIRGVGVFQTLKKNSKIQEYTVSIVSQSATFKINTFYFPGWHVFVDGKELVIDRYRDKVNGTMIIDLPSGEHKVKAIFTKTTVRAISDIVSAISWLFLLIFLGILVTKKKYFKTSQ